MPFSIEDPFKSIDDKFTNQVSILNVIDKDEDYLGYEV